MELAIKVLQKDIEVLDILILENETPAYTIDWIDDRDQLMAAITKLREEQVMASVKKFLRVKRNSTRPRPDIKLKQL